MVGRERERKKGSRQKRRMAVILTAALLLTRKTPLLAVESDRDNSIRSVRVENAQIRESTLVIGSYLIDLKGLNDHIYEIAQDSAGEFSQSRLYYKSELAGGQWFEISDATSIRDITNAGTPVSPSVIEALAFTHRVAADGTVTDLRVQAAVNEFDIPDPYDLEEMEELQPIKMHYQYLQSKETKTKSDESYLEIMEIFYGLSIEDDTTRDCDASLDALNPYKLDVIAREKPGSWTEAVTAVMEGEDARRRVQSLHTLDSYLDELLKKAGGQDQEGLSPEEIEAFYGELKKQGSGIDYDDIVGGYDGDVSNDDTNVGNGDSSDGSNKGENWFEKWRKMRESYQKFLTAAGTYRGVVLDEAFQVDSDMIAAIGEAKSNIKTSISKYMGNLLTEGTTVSAQAVYRSSKDLIDCARAHDTPGCDAATGRLADIGNIVKGVIEDEDSEKKTLEEGLTGQALSAWQEILSDGAGQDYRQAKGEGAGQPALAAFLSQRETDADNARLEYQSMLTQLWKRMSNSLSQIDTEERINAIAKLQALPPADAAQSQLLHTVDRHKEWLRKSLTGLIAASGDSTALDQLLEEQEDLERQRLDALDENDLAMAKRLAAEMEAGQNDIDALRQDLYRTLTNPVSSTADRARAAAGMTEGSAGKLIGELADKINAAILNDGEKGSLDNDLAALTELAAYDTDAALAAVSAVRDSLDGASDGGLTETVGAQLADIEHKAGGAAGGTGSGGRLSEEQLRDLLADYLDGESGVLERDRAGALIALSRYAEDSHHEAAGRLAVSMADRFAARGNPYLYPKYEKETAACVSLQTVGDIFGYRYLFDDVHRTVTLQKTGEYYIFTAGDTLYEFTEGTAGKLAKEPVVKGGLYLGSDDGERIFACGGYYVPGSIHAVAETAEMEPVIEEIYNRLMGEE